MKILSFDAETNGLHGEAFAVGGVVLDGTGVVVDRLFARCPIVGEVNPWVAEHVLPALSQEPETHGTAREMRTVFWEWFASHKSGAVVVADCGWPVEAGLMSACVADDHSRAFDGPYPLHEVGSLLLAAGLDPLGSYGEVMLPDRGAEKHHPTYDAHVSALCARTALLRCHRIVYGGAS